MKTPRMLHKYFKTIFPLFVLVMLSSHLNAQQNELGNWLMYFGTNKINDKWSIHSEVQYRNHTVSPTNIEQLLLRTGVNYHLNKSTILTLGYGNIGSYVFESEQAAPESLEHRIFQQLILKNKVNRLTFEHRYRIEQRWVNEDYKNRFRYRLMAFIPLNNKEIKKGTFFLGIYDEIFMNSKNVYFDRNRLYGGLGYQINDITQAQVGYLRQTLNNGFKDYLQFSIVFNPNLSRQN